MLIIPAVVGSHDRPSAPQGRLVTEPEQILRPLADVDVGILLVGDERRRRLQHQRRDVAVEVELAAEHRVRTDDLAQAGQQVALAVVVALRHHGAVHVDEHEVERQRGLGLREDAIAIVLVDAANRPPGRLGEGAKALDDLVPSFLGTRAPDVQRLAEGRGRMAGRIAVEERCVQVRLLARRQRGEGVGLGPETGDEDAHGHFLRMAARNTRPRRYAPGHGRLCEATVSGTMLPGRRCGRHNRGAPVDGRTKGAASWKSGFTETPTVNPIATM